MIGEGTGLVKAHGWKCAEVAFPPSSATAFHCGLGQIILTGSVIAEFVENKSGSATVPFCSVCLPEISDFQNADLHRVFVQPSCSTDHAVTAVTAVLCYAGCSYRSVSDHVAEMQKLN